MPEQRDLLHVLMFDATGKGGVARSVNLLASHLAATREVHVYSVLRNTDEPVYPIDPAVQVHWLVDNRRDSQRRGRPRHDRLAHPWRQRLDRRPSALEADPASSAYVDHVLSRTLSRLAPGVLLTTRPMLHVAAARWAPPTMTRIAQDHLNYEARMRNPAVTALLDEAVPTVRAFVTLTEADRRDYEGRYPGTAVVRIPNASPFGLAEPAPERDRVVLSAGRLVGRKGFDRLLTAWAPVAREFPDWHLHVWGEGECRADLEAQVQALGLAGSVRLPGHTDDLGRELAQASVFAMSSRSEGFPMVLLEASSHALPLVAFDCPRGPAELIEDGVNGRLVRNGDVAGFTAALRSLVADADLRRRLSAASYERARLYQVPVVVERWERLLADAAASLPVRSRTGYPATGTQRRGAP